jgi:hypothetical protein
MVTHDTAPAAAAAPRRDLLRLGGTAAGSSLLLLAAGEASATSAAGTDAELIAACRALADEAEYNSLADASEDLRGVARDGADAALKAAWERREAAYERVCGTPARTAAGLRWKPRALRATVLKDREGGPYNPEDRLAWSLAGDLLGEASDGGSRA